MRSIRFFPLILLFVGQNNLVDASLGRVLRQSSESEQEATTAKSQPAIAATTQQQPQQTNRLYPDIPQQPNFLPPFAGVSPNNYPAISHHHGQTPFVPLGVQIPPSSLNTDQQPVPFGRVLPQPRQVTPAERLQSQSFANGLGRRLLSMVGIETNASSNNDASNAQVHSGPADETLKALHNSTILAQLNKGVNSIYAGLSRIFNSTVQQQLDLLQDRFKSETQNSTNPWHQRMAEQVPQFFKQMASRVGNAQEQLNRVMQDVMQAAQGNTSVLTRAGDGRQSRSFFGSFDQFMNNPQGPGDFFNNVGRSLGFGNGQQQVPQAMAQQSNSPSAANEGQARDLAGQLREFWHSQVQPKIGMVRNQMSRVWRDLTSSGAFRPEMMMRARSPIQGQNESSSDLVDDILKEIDMNGSEYTLIDSKGETTGEPANRQQVSGSDNTGIKLSPQMQNRLIGMQRELNQLWMGLTNSIQSAIDNVKRTVNIPTAQFGSPTPNLMASSDKEKLDAADPALNEIEGKVKNLSKLQRDADMVYDTLEQQQREAQQRNNFGDRFKSFFNNMNVDLNGVNQLPDRIGQSFNRFGVVVGDLWNQIPERWDNFMHNMRPQHIQQQADIMAKMKSPASTTSTENPKPER